MGQLFSNLNFIGSAGYIQRLLIGVHCHKVHALRAGADHAVHHIVAAAAHADDLDIDNGVRTGLQPKCHSGASCYHL